MPLFIRSLRPRNKLIKYIKENTNFNDVDKVYFYTIVNSDEEYEEYYKYEW